MLNNFYFRVALSEGCSKYDFLYYRLKNPVLDQRIDISHTTPTHTQAHTLFSVHKSQPNSLQGGAVEVSGDSSAVYGERLQCLPKDLDSSEGLSPTLPSSIFQTGVRMWLLLSQGRVTGPLLTISYFVIVPLTDWSHCINFNMCPG